MASGDRRGAGRRALLLCALTLAPAGCETRPSSTGADAPSEGGATRRRARRLTAACAEQLDEFTYAVSHYQTRFALEELDKLLALVTPADPDCVEAARVAVAAVARRWHKAFVDDGQRDHYTPARRALDVYFERFEDAPDRGELGVLLGDVELTRATATAEDAARYSNHEELDPEAIEHFERAHAAYERALLESWDAIEPSLRERASGRDVDALTRRLALLPRARRAELGARAWSTVEYTCLFDHQCLCADGPGTLPPVTAPPYLLELLAAHERHYRAHSPDDPGVAPHYGPPLRRWLERAALRMAHGQLDEAATELEAVFLSADEDEMKTRAGVLLSELELVRWLAIPEARAPERHEAAARLSDALLRSGWSDPRSALSDDARARLAQTARALDWWRADFYRREAARARDRQLSREAATIYLTLHNESQEHYDRDQRVALLDGAMASYFDAGLYGQGMKIGRQLADAYPDAPATPDTVYKIARGYERLIEFAEARAWYGRFLDQYRRHARAGEVRRRLVWIAVLLGESPDDELARLGRGSPDERRFAAAVRYRALVDREHDAAALEAYLAAFDREHSALRSALAHARAAQILFKRSCPVDARAGLCVQLSREHTLGRVLPRDPKLRARALAHVQAARARMAAPGWDDDPIAERFDAPLSIERREIAAAEATLALIEGDLGAESALLTLPPVSRDPERTAAWFGRRREKVEEMAAAYARIEDLTSPGYAATVAARMGLIYEADSTIMLTVSPSVKEQGGAALAGELDGLTRTRREQARTAYNDCLARVREWGDDAEGRAPVCRAGLGRLLRRYDDPLEYLPATPDTWLLGQ